jgi:hypothetical protein
VAVDEDTARLRVEDPVQQRQRRRLARAGGADEGDGVAGLRHEGQVEDGGALAVIGEGDVLEGDGAFDAADVEGVRPVADLRRCVDTSKKSLIFGPSRKTALMKPTSASSLPISMVAKPMKVTISPMEARPLMCSQVPTRKIERTVSVAEAREATAAIAHQERTGICAASSASMVARMARTSASMRVKDWITGTLPRASEARSARAL